jgi:hypothetical protein
MSSNEIADQGELRAFVDHYHRERNHQELENRPIEESALGCE